MTNFSEKVYSAVLNIPLGQTRTYKWVAKQAGRPAAYRAVGTILRNNPYPVIIPCHRVIKSNNIPGGYAFGRERKKTLLRLEKEIKGWLTNKE